MNKNITSVAVLAMAVTLSVLVNVLFVSPKKANATPFRISTSVCDSSTAQTYNGDALSNGSAYATSSDPLADDRVWTNAGAFIYLDNVNTYPFSSAYKTLTCSGSPGSQANLINSGINQVMTGVKLEPLGGATLVTGDAVRFDISCCTISTNN